MAKQTKPERAEPQLVDEWYTIAEVATLLKVNRSTVQRWIGRRVLKAKDLHHGRMSRKLTRIHRDWLYEYLNRDAPSRKHVSRAARSNKKLPPMKVFV